MGRHKKHHNHYHHNQKQQQQRCSNILNEGYNIEDDIDDDNTDDITEINMTAPESAPELTTEVPDANKKEIEVTTTDAVDAGDVSPEPTPTKAAATEAAVVASSTTSGGSGSDAEDKTNELLAVVDEQESKDQAPEVFSAAGGNESTPVEDEEEDDDDDDEAVGDESGRLASESEFFEGIQAPPEKNEDEKYDDDAPPAAMQETTAAIEQTKAAALAKKKKDEAAVGGVGGDTPPDFSQYQTNVAQRLWNAQQVADKEGKNQSGELIRLLKEYQVYRTKVRHMIKAADDYQAALKNVTSCRGKLFGAYADIAKDTPIWDSVGKPLTPEQQTKIQRRGEKITPEAIEMQSKSIMEVAEEVGGGSVVAMQELAAMHDSLNQLDYESRIIGYIDEWDAVVTSHLDDELTTIRNLQKGRDHYIHKVDKLRNRINKIENRGARDAPDPLIEKLDRNEGKLEKADEAYEDMANDMVVVLDESIRRGWVDLYPLLKNAIKFEVNRIGRENASYGRFPLTLDNLKADYKDATKGTVDYPGYKPSAPEKPASA